MSPPSRSAPPTAHYDPDWLLAGYPAAWAQGALFDLRGGRAGATGYDELVDATGDIRPGWSEFAEVVGERGRTGLDRLRATVSALVDNDGITYISIDHGDDATGDRHGIAAPTPWHLDGLPLLVSPGGFPGIRCGTTQPAA